MVVDELKYKILQQFGFPPTLEQANALDVFARFLTDRNPQVVMILRDYFCIGFRLLIRDDA